MDPYQVLLQASDPSLEGIPGQMETPKKALLGLAKAKALKDLRMTAPWLYVDFPWTLGPSLVARGGLGRLCSNARLGWHCRYY